MKNLYHIVKLNPDTNSWIILSEANTYDELDEKLDWYWRIYPNAEITILERRDKGED